MELRRTVSVTTLFSPEFDAPQRPSILMVLEPGETGRQWLRFFGLGVAQEQ